MDSGRQEIGEQLNRRLAEAIRLQEYGAIRVLILFWEDGDPGFKAEGTALGQIFESQFYYSVVQFAIPSLRSQLELQVFVMRSLLDVQQEAERVNSQGLLIIHYGGHADRNAGRGEQKRSVWAA
jgi:hypothetical protein